MKTCTKTRNLKQAVLLLLIAILSASAVKAQETATVTIGYLSPLPGNSSNTSNRIPLCFEYHYSLTQQIYKADEIGMSGTITSISFYSDYSVYMQNVEVYMKHTQKSEGGSQYNFEPVTATDKVFQGTLSAPSEGWITLTLNTPFEYNYADNLLVCCRNTTFYDFNNYGIDYFRIQETLERMTLVRYAGEVCPLDGTGVYNNNSETCTYRNVIQLEITPFYGPQPLNPTATDVTDISATLVWEAPETDQTITGYAFQYKENSSSSWENGGTTTETSVTLGGLMYNKQYQFRVKALYGNHASEYVSTNFYTQAIYLPNLTVSELFDQSATITWDAPETSYTLTGYAYSYKNAIIQGGWHNGNTTNTTVTLTGLEGGTKYIFYAKALFSDHDSPHYQSFIYFTTVAYTLPNLTVSEITDQSATFSWEIPQTPYTITGYAYQYKKTTDTNWSDEITTTGNSVALSGLSGGTEYQFRAKVLFSDHEGFYTDIGFTTVAITLPNLTVSNVSDYQATLTWEAPQTPYTITGYNYQYKKTPDSGWSAEITTTDTFVTLSGLSGDTEYQFRAKVLFSDHEGVYTDIGFTTFAIMLPNMTVSDITGESATLTWEAPQTPYTITGYAYQYKKTTDAEWSIETINSNTSVTLVGLSSITEYQFRAKVLFSDHEGIYTDIGFTTAMSLPYECGFESGTDGWRTVNLCDLSGISWTHHNGEKSFQFHHFSTGEHDPQYLISPQIPDADGVIVSFYHFTYSGINPTFQIGYSTSSNDPASFTWIETITTIWNEWNNYEHIFPEGTKYIAISYDHVDNYISYSINLDDFSFTEYSPYPKPTSLTVSNLTDQSATLTWTTPGTNLTVTGYAYQYKPATDAVWSTMTTVNGTSVTLNGLSANTNYDFRVKALYTGGNSSNYVSTRLMTEGPMESLPHYQGFENGMGGWRVVDGVTTTGISNYYSYNGSLSFQFCYDSNQRPQYLFTPQFDGSHSMLVSFYHRTFNYDNTNHTAIFQVGYSTTTKNLNAFTWIDTNIATASWAPYETSFPEGVKYVAVKWIGGYYLYLDDFCFERCYPIPTDLAVNNLTDHNATLSWTAPETDETITGYAYQYRIVNDVNWSAETTVNATSVTLNGLSANTNYIFRVKTVYAGDYTTAYVSTNFMTEGGIENLPHYQGFENGMGGWRIVEGASNTGVLSNGADYIHNGSYSFAFLDNENTPNPQYLISPQFDGNSGKMVSFYFINAYTDEYIYYSRFQIGYSSTTKDLGAFLWGDTILSAYDSWQFHSETFPSGTKYIAVKWVSGVALALDDFSIDYPCDEIVVNPTYPLTEGFENNMFPPRCWDNPYIFEENITKQWMRSNYRSHSGYTSAYCSYSGHHYYLKMPSFYLAENTGEARLTFWSLYRPSASNNYGNCSVVMMDGNNETELWTTNVASIQKDVWYETNIDLTAYIGQTISLAFKHEGNIPSYWYIDDVEVSVPWLGNGTEQNPYLITTIEQLEMLAERVNNGNDYNGKYFRLANNLNYNSNTANNHTPIGNGPHRFRGIFDGDGHTISGIRISGSDSYLGIFGGCYGSMVKNLTLTDAQISGDLRVGGIVGDNYLGTVENCHVVNSTLSGSGLYIGGAVGWNDRGTLSGNTVLFTTVSAGGGAILGTNQNGTLYHNYYSGCTLGEVTYATNVGTSSGDIPSNDGAIYIVLLRDDGTGNTATIAQYANTQDNFLLYGRTLYKDGAWNTLCLPFGVTSFAGTPLENVEARMLRGASLNNGVLTLRFGAPTNQIKAGIPYIIKWESGGETLSPIFHNVTITATEPSTVSFENGIINYIGNYVPFDNTSGLLLDTHNADNGAFHAALQVAGSCNYSSIDTLFCTINTFPWTEDFEDYDDGTPPDCWDNSASTSSTNNQPENLWCIHSHGGNKMLRLLQNGLSSGTARINSPTITLPSDEECDLYFSYSHRSSSGPFTVRISEDGGATFVDLASYGHSEGQSNSSSDPGGFTQAFIPLADYAGKSVVIQFSVQTGDNNDAIFIDDLEIQAAPPCRRPTALAVSAITHRSAELSWSANSNETEWTLYYKKTTDSGYTAVAGVTDNPYTLCGLENNTDYECYVVAHCSPGYASDPSLVSNFHTMCSVSFPFMEDFEDNALNCWNSVSSGWSLYHFHSLTNYDSYMLLCNLWYSGAINTPVIDLPQEPAEIVLDFAHTQSTHPLIVKISEDYGATFTELASLVNPYAYWNYLDDIPFIQTLIPLDDYVGKSVIIQFCASGGLSNCNILMDNLEIRVAPPCSIVTELRVDNIQENSVSLSWTANNDESEWTVYYKKETNTEYTTVTGVTSNPYTLDNLEGNTNYECYVTANCSNLYESEPSQTIRFSTICVPYTITATTPYIEDFESPPAGTSPYDPPTKTPRCWNTYNDQHTHTDRYSPHILALSSSASSALHTGQILLFTDKSGNQFAALPEFTNPLSQLQITFKYYTRERYTGQLAQMSPLYLGYITEEDDHYNTFTAIQEYICTEASCNQLLQVDPVDLSELPANATRLVFYFVYDGNYAQIFYVDDVEVSLTPCSAPSALGADNITASSATLHWTANGGESEWTVYYKKDTDTDYTAVPGVTDNPYTLQGLDDFSDYEYYVVAHCSAESSSLPSRTFSFSTPCGDTFPWDFENFESYTVPRCWDNSASTSTTVQSDPEYIWGVFQYHNNKMLRLSLMEVNYGTALINTPTVLLPSEGVFGLTFDYSHQADCGPFTVKISTDGGDTFADLASFDNLGSSTSIYNPIEFHKAFIPLTDYAGQEVIIQFYAVNQNNDGSIFVDNLDLSAPPACCTPFGLSTDIVTAHTAGLGWHVTAPMESYTVRHRTKALMVNPIFIEGFENGIGDWTFLSSHNYTNVSTSNNSHSGNAVFRFCSYGTPPQYLISPMLSGLGDGMRLEFYYRSDSQYENETFQIGYSTTDNETGSFTFGDEVSTADGKWHLYSEAIPAGTKYICWKYLSQDESFLYIDDIAIGEDIPAGGWQTMTVTGSGSHVSATLTGLTSSTFYEVQVKSNCDEAQWSPTLVFSSRCEVAFPWSEDFEAFDNNTVPDCWDNSTSTTYSLNVHPYYVWGVYSYEGNKMIRMHNKYTSQGTALINSLTLTLPSDGLIRLRFDYSHTASCGPFIVKMIIEDGATIDLASYSNEGTSTSDTDPGEFTEALIPLTAYAGMSVMFQFYATPDHGQGAIFVDNIEIGHLSENGDEYTIYDAAGWNLFCDALQDNDTYNRFYGKTVKLGADISVTRMAGSINHDFKGTFDGQGHTLTLAYGTAGNPLTEEYAAPFRYVENGANIHSLNVEGHIYTSNKYAGGIVGCQWGTVSVSNCRSSVIIHSSKSGDGTHGGVVANQRGGALTVSGCIFDGRMLTTNGTTLCGGLVGYHNNGTCTLSDCLYAPATDVTLATDETYIATGATFCRNYNGTPANCYYIETLGEAQGKLAHSITGRAVTPAFAGEATEYDVSGLSTNGVGLALSTLHSPLSTLLAANGDQVSLTLMATAGFSVNAATYTPEGGTATELTPVNGVYSFSMPDADVVVDATEYLIQSATEWDHFCDALQDNDTYNRFIGKTVKLGADISVTRMAGSNYHDFMGTFDGQGHTLTVAYGTAENPLTEDCAAPFRYVSDGAVIHSLNVEGHIYTSNQYAGGIIGCQYYTVSLSNCRSGVIIHSSKNGDGTHGGIVAVQHHTLTVSGCIFNGRLLTTNGTTLCSGLVGWCSGTCTLSDCLYAPAEVTLAPGETYINAGATFCRHYDESPTNCFYTETMGTAQGLPAISDPAITPSGQPTATYTVSGLTAYANGLLYGETYYFDPEATVTQTAALTAGWNWWAPMVPTNVATLQAALGDNLLLLTSQEGTPTGDLTLGKMYKIKALTGGTLQITGNLVSTLSVTIAPGTNWFGYTGSQPKAIQEVFNTPADGDKMISQNDGFAIFNGVNWEGTLTQLTPGQGYVYLSKGTGSKTASF